MSNLIEKRNVGNYVVKMYYDSFPTSPREMNENFGKVAMFHSRYHFPNDDDYTQEQALAILENKEYLSLLVYAYEHGNISLSTKRNYPFNCQWDSSCVGITYVSHENIIKTFGKLDISKATALLESEIEEYSHYLNGEVFGYEVIEKVSCDSCNCIQEKDIDSCWGYIGRDYFEEQVKGICNSLNREVVCNG